MEIIIKFLTDLHNFLMHILMSHFIQYLAECNTFITVMQCVFPPSSEWCEIIRRVRGMPEAKVKSLLAQEVDPRKALMTIDLELIDSVSALDQEKK